MRKLPLICLIILASCGKGAPSSKVTEAGLFRDWLVTADISNSGGAYVMDLRTSTIGVGAVVYTQGAAICDCPATITGDEASGTFDLGACTLRAGSAGVCTTFHSQLYFFSRAGDVLTMVGVDNLHLAFAGQ